MSPHTIRIHSVLSPIGIFGLVLFFVFFTGAHTVSATCYSSPNACGQTNVGDVIFNGVCSASWSPTYSTVYTYSLTPSGNYLGTYDDFRGGGYNGVSTQQSLNYFCSLMGRSTGTGAYACAPNQNPQGCLNYDKNGSCTQYGSTYYYPESRHNGGWGYHYQGQGWCEEGGVQWIQCSSPTPVSAPSNASCPAPTTSVSVSQDPVPYGGNPGFTLYSANAYYCYVLVDWATYILSNYATSGTYYYGAFTSPGTHVVSSYCYNSAWAGSGWSSTYFTVASPPTSSVSISQNPVPYGGNPGFTLSSSNAYYCYVLVDWATYILSNYATSGTYYYGAFTSPGGHVVSSYCYNSAWAGQSSGWSNTYFTVDSPPTSSVSVSPNPVPYGANPGITLSSTNGYYCHVYMDWNNVASGYFGSGTYYPGAMTSPGTHSAETYCYNSAWQNPNGWTVTYFTVASPPTASVSISQNPVPYGGNPTFTLSSTNAYYCYLWVDGTYLVNGYTTSGSFNYGAFTSPGSHYMQAYCYNSAWSGSGWSGAYFTVASPPTSSLSVSPNPVPYNSAPTFTLSSTNAYYCHILMDGTWAWSVSGYFGSGSFSPGALTSPGTHGAWSYCYNSAWQNPNGWSITYFTVASAPSASVSVSPNPVPYGGAPTFTLSTSNGYYSHVLMDGVWNWNASGYFTSGPYSPGALYSPGAHSAWAYTYNSAWIGSGWSTTNFTVASPPTSSVSVSPNPVTYGGNPGVTLSSTNAYYCYVRVDGNNLPGTPGYFTSGTFYPGPQTSVGRHTASSYCYNSAWQGSGWTDVRFTVNHSPVSSVSCSGSPSSVYVSQPVTWNSSVSGGSGSFTYSWSGTDGLSGTTASVQKAYTTAGTKQATVAVTDTVSGQTSSASCNSGSGITVNSCTGSLSASPTTVQQGQNTSLTWIVSGGSSCATSCTGSGFSTGGATSGSAPSSVPPTPPTTSYALSCTGGTYGPPPSVNTTVTVLTPEVSISVNGQPLSARVNPAASNNTTIAWSSTNATSCSVTKNSVAWRSGLSSSGITESVSVQTVYEIDCVNDHGSHATASVTVNVPPLFKEF